MAVPAVAGAALQTGAPVTQTAGPDAITATLVPSLPNTAEICFDREIDNASLGFLPGGTGLLSMLSYETLTGSPATHTRVTSPSDPSTCAPGRGVMAEFNPTRRLDQHTLIAVPEGAVADLDGDINVPAQLPLTGSTLAPTAGAIVGPKLTSVTTNATLNNATFTYDRPIDTSVGALPANAFGAGSAGNFGFETVSGQTLPAPAVGSLPNLGLLSLAGLVTGTPDAFTGTIVGAANTTAGTGSVTVHFPRATDLGGGASVTQAKRWVSDFGAVRSAQTDLIGPSILPGNRAPSTLDVIGKGDAKTERPDLLSAVPVAGQPGVFDLTYDTAVVTLGIGQPILTMAVTEEGQLAPGIVAARPNNQPNVVRVAYLTAFIPGLQAALQANLVKIIDFGGAAIDLSIGQFSSPGAVDIATVKRQAGYSSAPDVTGVKIDRVNDQATVSVDEPVVAVDPIGNTFPQVPVGLLATDSAFNLPNEFLAAPGILFANNGLSFVTQYSHPDIENSNGVVVGQWFGTIDALLPMADPTAGPGGWGVAGWGRGRAPPPPRGPPPGGPSPPPAPRGGGAPPRAAPPPPPAPRPRRPRGFGPGRGCGRRSGVHAGRRHGPV